MSPILISIIYAYRQFVLLFVMQNHNCYISKYLLYENEWKLVKFKWWLFKRTHFSLHLNRFQFQTKCVEIFITNCTQTIKLFDKLHFGSLFTVSAVWKIVVKILALPKIPTIFRKIDKSSISPNAMRNTLLKWYRKT